jgi:hypothetical protein
MKHTAILKTKSGDVKNVAKALNVDNIELGNLKITSKACGNRIITKLESNNPNTLLSTLDDIISCQMVAEKVIR